MVIPPTILIGSRGPNVETWQRIIGIKSDGVFGKATLASTKDWQLAHGLIGDGVVGARTWTVALQLGTPSQPKGYPFVQARNYTKGPRRGPIDLIVLHSMETPDKPNTAYTVAHWFASPASPKASAHYCVDNKDIWQCVADQDIAWHAPGANNNGIGIEHAGYANQSASDWRDEYSRTMLWDHSARLCAELCAAYKIPVQYVDAAGLVRKERGITTHKAVTDAFGGGKGHWDPGPNFPIVDYLVWVNNWLTDGTKS